MHMCYTEKATKAWHRQEQQKKWHNQNLCTNHPTHHTHAYVCTLHSFYTYTGKAHELVIWSRSVRLQNRDKIATKPRQLRRALHTPGPDKHAYPQAARATGPGSGRSLEQITVRTKAPDKLAKRYAKCNRLSSRNFGRLRELRYAQGASASASACMSSVF